MNLEDYSKYKKYMDDIRSESSIKQLDSLMGTTLARLDSQTNRSAEAQRHIIVLTKQIEELQMKLNFQRP